MYPDFQSAGNWFNLYEVSTTFLAVELFHCVTGTVSVDECYWDLEILILLGYLICQV